MDALPQSAPLGEDGDETPVSPLVPVSSPDTQRADPSEPAQSASLPVASSLDARFMTLAGTLPDLVSLHEPKRGCVYASAASRSLLGAEPSDLVGRDWVELVPPEDENPFAAGAGVRVSHRMLRPYGPPLVAET